MPQIDGFWSLRQFRSGEGHKDLVGCESTTVEVLAMVALLCATTSCIPTTILYLYVLPQFSSLQKRQKELWTIFFQVSVLILSRSQSKIYKK